MLNLPKIFEEIALEKERLASEKAQIKAKALKAKKAWSAECDRLRAELLNQAADKAEQWLKKELIMPNELLRVEEFANGLILYISVDDAEYEEKEWEVKFLFFFGGESPESLSIEWADVNETRNLMQSYYPCSY